MSKRKADIWRECDTEATPTPAKPWHDGVKFRGPEDRAKAELAVQQMTAAMTAKMCNDRDQHAKEMCARYDNRIARLEADLREAYQRNADHLIQRARSGNQTLVMKFGPDMTRGGDSIG